MYRVQVVVDGCARWQLRRKTSTESANAATKREETKKCLFYNLLKLVQRRALGAGLFHISAVDYSHCIFMKLFNYFFLRQILSRAAPRTPSRTSIPFLVLQSLSFLLNFSCITFAHFHNFRIFIFEVLAESIRFFLFAGCRVPRRRAYLSLFLG